MKKFQVIGNPINHSLSPNIHNFFANQFNLNINYQKQLVSVDNLDFENHVRDFFTNGGYGLNITLPFKERAYNLSDIKHPNAEFAKSANTLWYENGKIHADNTDGIGLITDVKENTNIDDKNILILGAGGATKGIIYPLIQQHPQTIYIANRTLQKAIDLSIQFNNKIIPLSIDNLQDYICDFDVIINATSMGMNENVTFDLDKNFHIKTFAYDMIYNKFSPFKQWAISNNLEFKDGKGMLINQAKQSFFIWHNIMPSIEGINI